MNNPTIAQIIEAIEKHAPLTLQEDYDNSGLLVGDASQQCTGVLLCVDVTPKVVSEAIALGFNLIISHHPVIFKGIKQLTGTTPEQEAVILAIKANVAIYASHTAMDNAPGGVSHRMATLLNLQHIEVLEPQSSGPTLTGSGAVGTLPSPIKALQFVELVKHTFSAQVARCTLFNPNKEIKKVAMCGGSGAFLIDRAIAAGADAYISADIKYHDFAHYASKILLVDIGHFESEQCITAIFNEIIQEIFPNFAVRYANADKNPIIYI